MARVNFVFEVSWEVCNMVGGIYRVVESKARYMTQKYDKSYFLLGPYFPDKNAGTFIEEPTPPLIKRIFETLKAKGITCYFGKWRISGSPQTILIDFSKAGYLNNEIKGRYWNNFGIDSLNTSYYDYDEPILWSSCAGMLIEEFEKINPEKNIVAQFHEWLSGGGILHLKSINSKVACIFTTHATVMGRAIAGKNMEVFFEAQRISDFDLEAKKYSLSAKHLTEKVCANISEIFSTVSEITSKEAEKILSKKADIVLENGINPYSYPTFEEISVKHKSNCVKQRKFMMEYFYPYYTFDIEQTLTFFISSRYEFYSKGMNILIEALSILDERLRREDYKKKIVVFFFVPAATKGIDNNVIRSKVIFDDLLETIKENNLEITQRLIYSLLKGANASYEDILGSELYENFIESSKMIKRVGNPPLSTHIIADESDSIISMLRRKSLVNSQDNIVKTIFYPIYLNGPDGLLDMDYNEAISASHLAIFPSTYEPWGYTPLEAISCGVPAITSNLAGYGKFIIEKGAQDRGIFVLDFENKGFEDRAIALAKKLYWYCSLDRSQRVDMKILAKQTSNLASWETLANKYFEAHEIAISKALSKRGGA